ncbi:protein SDA1 homolog [Mya arenaria]|uniref:protein SDA1 homolog n=1 Tax=Mya arenaria TaxID=6604 RepID=UPI0022DFF088|nr:protein SDA1 homolog [Mya arenaria]
MMASRSLIQLYRKVNPELLGKKDKGKPTEASKDLKVLEYGEKDTRTYIPGTEALKNTEDIDEEELEQEAWESCSEEEDNDYDGEWLDVHHSSDEEEVDDTLVPETSEVQEAKAKSVSTTRVLSQEEFRQLQQRQAARETEGMKTKTKGKGKKRKREKQEEEQERGGLLSLSMIENVHKKRAHDKESRLATVMAGREDRPKNTHGHKKMSAHASTTNKDKLRGKAYTMIKHKVMNRKKKRSFRDKQI